MNYTSKTSDRPWGMLRPATTGQVLHFLVNAGVAHGKVKKLIANIWRGVCGDEPVDVVVRGVKYRLDFRDNTPAVKVLFASHYEARELRYLHKANRLGGVFVDIGANIGYFSLDVAARGTRVLAIEPNPVVFQRLLFNIESNKLASKVTAIPCCVAEPGIHTLSCNGESFGTGSLVALHGNGDQMQVEGDSLYNLLKKYDVDQVASLKIDIEGAEDQALVPFFETAPRTLWPRCVVVEHSNHTVWKRDLIQVMLDGGYHIVSKQKANSVLWMKN